MIRISRPIITAILAFISIFIACTLPVNAKDEGPRKLNEDITAIFQMLNDASGSDTTPDQTAKSISPQTPLIKSKDLENQTTTINTGPECETYKCGVPTYFALPTTISIDTGKCTELDLTSDFLTYQYPGFALNDWTASYKWCFRDKSPKMSIVGTLVVPTSSGSIGCPQPEPGFIYTCDVKLGKKWEFTTNLGASWISAFAFESVTGSRHRRRIVKRTEWVNGRQITIQEVVNYLAKTNKNIYKLEHFLQATYGGELDYKINDKDTLSLACTFTCPDAYPDGVNTTLVTVGYSRTINDKLSCNLSIEKGLSPVDIDWGIILGLTRSF